MAPGWAGRWGAQDSEDLEAFDSPAMHRGDNEEKEQRPLGVKLPQHGAQDSRLTLWLQGQD